jgi:hypothetical protein
VLGFQLPTPENWFSCSPGSIAVLYLCNLDSDARESNFVHRTSSLEVF